jgi:hypothetical protein
MSANADWQAAFLAVSTLLGEPQDVATAALGEAGARGLAGGPGATSRQARAAAVARTVAGLLAELERARLA